MKNHLPQLGLTLAAAALIGLAVSLFQLTLQGVLVFHAKFPFLVWGLPVAWIFFWATARVPAWRGDESTDRILNEVRRPTRKVSPWHAPLIWTRTLWSHLFGASVGRESAALQIAASLGDLFQGFLVRFDLERGPFLRSSLAAGLASAFHTPWAGFVFALELGGALKHRDRLFALGAAWVAFGTARLFNLDLLPVPRLEFVNELLAEPSLWVTVGLAVLAAPAFKLIFLSARLALRPLPIEARWALGGVLGLGLFWIAPVVGIRGLGLEAIETSFSENMGPSVFLLKGLATAIFTATGWFGGDFTPLMAIGAAAGNAFATWSGFPIPMLGAAIGLFLPVGFTHRILATGWVMTLEVFGWKVALVAAPAFLAAWLLDQVMAPLFRKLQDPRLPAPTVKETGPRWAGGARH